MNPFLKDEIKVRAAKLASGIGKSDDLYVVSGSFDDCFST